jgi:hypothetical protein
MPLALVAAMATLAGVDWPDSGPRSDMLGASTAEIDPDWLGVCSATAAERAGRRLKAASVM